MQRIGVVVLAAGASRRMGTSKPLLRIGGRTLIARLVSVFREAGVESLRVVVRPHDGALTEELGRLGAPCAVNAKPDEGMFSSVRIGVAALPRTLDAFFVHPVDVPLLSPGTPVALMHAAGADALVVHPTFEGRRGHPPLISGSLRPAVSQFDGNGGLRSLLSRYASRTCDVPCDDPGILFDLDTPQDYREACERASWMADGM